MMMTRNTDLRLAHSRKKVAVAIGIAAVLLLATGAAASRSAVQDRRLAIADVEPLAALATTEGGIPLVANELVVDRLNRFLGSPEKRQKLRDELAAMNGYRTSSGELVRDLIKQKLEKKGMPVGLLAVPLFESGFQNESRSPLHAAGIWQFIPTTARRYGLTVAEASEAMASSGIDERLDPVKSTDAAIRYLRDLHRMFRDWRLALRGYNEGEAHVRDMIRENNTRDPWALERTSSVEDYLPGVAAMMIILHNPTLLD